MHKLRNHFCVTSLLGFLALAGCSRSSGTYVLLDFQGTVSTEAPVERIEVALKMGDAVASAVFAAGSGGSIRLETTATLKIEHGSGHLDVTAIARSAEGTVLGTGKGSGEVVAGQTATVKVTFGSGGTDGGSGADGSADVQPDSADDGAVDRAGPDVSGGVDSGAGDLVGPDHASEPDQAAGSRDAIDADTGTGGAGGTDGSTGTGGMTGTGGAGGQDAAGPDGPVGGSGGGGGNGGAIGIAKIVSEPSALPFGEIPTGTSSAAMSTIIRNVGTAATPPLAASLSPTNAAFAMQANSTCVGRVLAPSDTCTISVVFSPATLGPASATLSVVAGSVAGTDISLTGTGTGKTTPVLALQPTQGTFGVIDVGSSGNIPFIVTNTGGASPSSLLVNASGPGFSIVSDECSNKALPANTSCKFAVSFAPTATGPANGDVTIKAADGTVSATASLTGTGRTYFTLTVNLAGNGGGTVAGSGLTCLARACTGQYATTALPGSPEVQTVTLTPKPDSNSTFGGWVGGGCDGKLAGCDVVLTSDMTLRATFNAPTVMLGLNAFGLAGHKGSVWAADGSFYCSEQCAPTEMSPAASIALKAVPDPGSTFIGWTDGPCTGTSSPLCTVPLTSDVIVSATFGPQAYMFITSRTLVPGQLGSASNADVQCSTMAALAGLPGTYVAWLASSAGPASTRIGPGGWVRVDGRPFARNSAALGVSTNQAVYYPPRIDESGRDAGSGHVLVATGGDYVSGSPGPCADYTSSSGSIVVGDAVAGSGNWADFQTMACSTPLRLYCFRSDLPPVDITPPPLAGRHVFVTASAWSPSGGMASADALCRADAATAGLANAARFVAVLATSTASAASRLSTGGAAWKRVDDVIVFQSPDDLANARILAPFGLTAKGDQYGTFFYWSGAPSPGKISPAGLSCQDWSLATSANNGLFGNANLSGGPEWFADTATTNNACSRTDIHLLCAEP